MIKTPEQIAGIREACKINTAVLDEVEKNIKTGMTTEEINTIVHEYTVSHGAIPAPLNFCGYPKSVCTSINDQVCHGIPSAQDVLKSGDIVNVDVSTIYNGYYADASRMFMIGKVDKKKQDLVAITKECLRRGLEAAQPWGFVGDIGAAVASFAHKHGIDLFRCHARFDIFFYFIQNCSIILQASRMPAICSGVFIISLSGTS